MTAGYREVLSLDSDNGGLIWKYQAGAPMRSVPTVAKGRVYVVNLDNKLITLDADDGSLVWQHAGIPEEEGVLGGASPAVDNDLVVVVYSSGEIFGLRDVNGSVAWSDNLSSLRKTSASWSLNDIRALPVIDKGQILVAGLSGRMVMLDRRLGARMWQKEIGALETPVLAGDFVYVLSQENQLVALTRKGGQVRWITQLRGFEDGEDRKKPAFWKGPVLAGGRLILTSSDEEVVEVDPKTGNILRDWDLPEVAISTPIVADETLIFLTQDAELLAYR